MDENEKKAGKAMMAKLMLHMLKHSSANVPQPLPMIEGKAKQRLSTDGLISWKIMLKEWEKVSAKDRKVISSLLTLNSFDLIETFDITSNLLDEQKATADFVRDHPEYGKSEEEIKAGLAAESFSDLFGD